MKKEILSENIERAERIKTEEKEILEKLRASENFKPNPGQNERGFFQRMKDMFQ